MCISHITEVRPCHFELRTLQCIAIRRDTFTYTAIWAISIGCCAQHSCKSRTHRCTPRLNGSERTQAMARHAFAPTLDFAKLVMHERCTSTSPVAQLIRHRPTEPGITGSSPAGVIIYLMRGDRKHVRCYICTHAYIPKRRPDAVIQSGPTHAYLCMESERNTHTKDSHTWCNACACLRSTAWLWYWPMSADWACNMYDAKRRASVVASKLK